MCGIVGAFKTDMSEGLEALRHRGPTSAHSVEIGGFYIGHTRLEIIAPGQAANQPLTYGPITVALNGEIWNYSALRAQLVDLGYQFNSEGDAEVLAALYTHAGPACFERVEGMFAAAIYDNRDGSLTLLRDRFGEIPLHYLPHPPYAFASEMKALAAAGLSSRDSLRLPPGHFARCDGRTLSIHAYYHIPETSREATLADASSELYKHLEAGVNERLIGEEEGCLLLSGGIDSTTIGLLLSRHNPSLQAYIGVYDHASPDLAAARDAATFMGIALHEVEILSPAQRELEEIVAIIEMPHKAQVEIAWPCHILAERIRADGFRVVFTGDGSDELWASYRFAQEKIDQGKADWYDYRKKLFLQQENKNFARANKIFMHHGIEPRAPFLHRPLVEFALSLNRSAVRDHFGNEKAILSQAFQGHLPDDLLSREKLAFQTGLGLREILIKKYGDTRKLYMNRYLDLYGAKL